MDYEAVFFDVDGTLIKTPHEYAHKIINRILHDLHKQPASCEDIERFLFESDRENAIRTGFNIEEPELFWDGYRKHDTPELRVQHAIPYHDVDFIRELKPRGYMTGILTGAPKGIALAQIDMIGEENFDVIVIANTSSGTKPKPSPDGLIKCLNSVGIKNSRAIYVGNGKEDVDAAKNAGVLDILIKRGEREFPNLKPSLTINSLYELNKILRK